MSAARSVAAGRVVVEGARFGSSILLAHLLTPAEIGRVVVVASLLPLVSLLLSGVIEPLLIQRADLSRQHLEAAAALAFGIGLALTMATLAVAPLLRATLGSFSAGLMPWLAGAFLFNALSVVPDALMRRRMQFRTLSIIEASGAVAGTGVTLGLVIAGADGRAIIIGAVVGMVIGSLAENALGENHRPRWHRAEAREILRLGGVAGLSGVADQFFRRVDYVVVSARLGAADIGAYFRAYQLGAEYQGRLTTVTLRVAFPLYSRIRELPELRRMHHRIVRLHGAILVPPLALLIAVAPVAVPFVFGKPWHAAVVPTQILAGVGMFNALSSSVGPHVLALGRAGLLSGLTWFAGFVYGLAIYLATSGGLIAVSATALGYSTVAFFVAWHLLVNRPLGLRWSHLARDAGAPFVVAAAIVAVCYPLTQLLRSADVIAPVTLAATGVAALAIYLALMPRLDHEGWRDVRRLVGGARRAGRTNGNGPAPAADAALATTGVSDLGAS